MSYDALLSQAGIPSGEVADLLPDKDQPQSEESSQEQKEKALKSAKALADLPGMPGFLKPTRTMAATDAAKAEQEQRTKDARESVTTASTKASDGNGQGFKVTVMVSPEGETSAEAAALRDGATSSKPAPVTFSSPYSGNGATPDPRYFPQNHAGSASFAPTSHPSISFGEDLNGMPMAGVPGAGPSFGFTPNPSIPLEGHQSAAFGANNSMPLGGAPGAAMGQGNTSFGQPSGGFDGGMGAVTYDTNGSMNPSFPFSTPDAGMFDWQLPSATPGDSITMPSPDEVAAAQMAAAQAANGAAMVDMMAAYGPDAVPEETKRRFFGKKKREKAAQKAAEEAAAYAAATAAAAAEAAAAEEIARHQPTAYIPTTPPSQFGGATPPSDPFANQPMAGMVGGVTPPGAPGAAGMAGAAAAAGAMGAMALAQPGMAIQPVPDTSGFDQLTNGMAPVNGMYPNAMMPDPSVTTGMPAVGQMGMMGANGSYMLDPMGMPSYDSYGHGANTSGMTPEGVAALEAMRTEMNDASASHNKRIRAIKIIIGSVVGLIAAAAITFGILIATNVISLDDLGIHIESGEQESGSGASSATGSLSYYSASSSSSSASSASSSSADSAASSDSGNAGGTADGSPNGAGDEVYHYTLTTIDGEHPAVTEVVSYDDNGLCLQTAMDAVFSTATAAQAFVERVRSDYGSNFLSGSVDGTTAHVVVNMARSKLTREGYENALRNVVDDLEIERLA